MGLLSSNIADIPSFFPLYLFYGGSFVFLGISITLKDLKESTLKLADILWLLEAFGFVHGLHEWLQIYPLLGEGHLSPPELLSIKTALLYVLIVSYFFLMQFGVLLLARCSRAKPNWLKVLPALSAAAWAGILWWRPELGLPPLEDGVRYSMALTGGILTGGGSSAIPAR